MQEEVFTSRQAKMVIEFVRERYGDELEFLWGKFPGNAIWRNPRNGKWYGALLKVSRRKLGFESDEEVEVLDLRFVKGEAMEFAESNAKVLPGYHMNKRNWITVVLDEGMGDEEILALVERSYEIVAG